MELDIKKSKALRISLLVLTVIILLSIGAAIGSHAGYNRHYGNNTICGRGDFNKFERNGRRGMMFNGERGQAQGVQTQGGFRMMTNQTINNDGQTVNDVPAPKLEATSTPIK